MDEVDYALASLEQSQKEEAKESPLIKLLDRLYHDGSISTTILMDRLYHGPINVTVYYIFKYLQQGKLEYAQLEYQNNGDKIHPFYMPTIKKILGCRLHLVKKCQRPTCKGKDKPAT